MEKLTPAQLKVLKLIAGGYSYAQIAIKLEMAYGTVRVHMGSKSTYGQAGVLERLKAPNNVAAVVIALKQGILKLEEIEMVTPEEHFNFS